MKNTQTAAQKAAARYTAKLGKLQAKGNYHVALAELGIPTAGGKVLAGFKGLGSFTLGTVKLAGKGIGHSLIATASVTNVILDGTGRVISGQSTVALKPVKAK